MRACSTQNTHQAELVNQLRQEAQQWKDQCLRLEETLRGEIKAWKDQFLRVDAEHSRLLNQQLSVPSSQVRPPRTPFIFRSTSLTPAHATEHARTGQHPEARPRPPARRRRLSDVFLYETRFRILVCRPRRPQARPPPLVHQSPAPARSPPRPCVHRSPRERGGPRARAAGLGLATTATVDASRRGAAQV